MCAKGTHTSRIMNQTKKSRKYIYANQPDTGWQGMEQELQANVYADSIQWRRFLNLLLPALGISLMVSGIIFFFAYNWADLNKFAKLGLLEGMLVIAIALVLFTRWNLPVKQIILTGASFLVGALFAVYGQIYQTGANAYDFFLGWTVFVTLWVIVSGYLPLWLVWIGLVNITIYFYKEQIAVSNEGLMVLLNNSRTLICTLAVIVAEGLYALGKTRKRTAWFINTVALVALASATLNVMDSILSGYGHLAVILPIALVIFVGGLIFGFCKRQLFYIATIPFCALLILDTFLFKLVEKRADIAVVLLMGLVLIAGTTGLVSLIIKLKKQGYGTAE